MQIFFYKALRVGLATTEKRPDIPSEKEKKASSKFEIEWYTRLGLRILIRKSYNYN